MAFLKFKEKAFQTMVHNEREGLLY